MYFKPVAFHTRTTNRNGNVATELTPGEAEKSVRAEEIWRRLSQTKQLQSNAQAKHMSPKFQFLPERCKFQNVIDSASIEATAKRGQSSPKRAILLPLFPTANEPNLYPSRDGPQTRLPMSQCATEANKLYRSKSRRRQHSSRRLLVDFAC
jgi:hypothetical protein